ncbi:MAG: glycosyltransferase, partial [Candidatus Zambryskibacteria bacterium]|nr:glycosyltransferase [Candidatus Zambryskibacteria bacterium]
MKIIYGITKSNFGGAQRYVFNLATEAKKLGHDVAVLCGEGGLLVEKLKAADIRTILIPGFGRNIDLINDAPRLWFIIKTIRQEQPDVFHINSAKMGGAGIFTGRLLGIKKIIFTAHGWAFNEPRPFWQKALIRFLSWVTILSAHKTICVSEKTKRDVTHFPFVQNKLVVIHNGLESFELLERNAARRALGIHEADTLVVGANSELHPVKGIDVLLDAWEKFTRKNHANLVLIGAGELRETLEDYATELGINDRVMFKGYVDNAKQYLAGLDIYCMPSRSEGLPYALLEAGIAGLPVIATKVGGIPEIVENGLSGALVPPD